MSRPPGPVRNTSIRPAITMTKPRALSPARNNVRPSLTHSGDRVSRRARVSASSAANAPTASVQPISAALVDLSSAASLSGAGRSVEDRRHRADQVEDLVGVFIYTQDPVTDNEIAPAFACGWQPIAGGIADHMVVVASDAIDDVGIPGQLARLSWRHAGRILLRQTRRAGTLTGLHGCAKPGKDKPAEAQDCCDCLHLWHQAAKQVRHL